MLCMSMRICLKSYQVVKFLAINGASELATVDKLVIFDDILVLFLRKISFHVYNAKKHTWHQMKECGQIWLFLQQK